MDLGCALASGGVGVMLGMGLMLFHMFRKGEREMGLKPVFCPDCSQGLNMNVQFGFKKHECPRCDRCRGVVNLFCRTCFTFENGGLVEREV